MSLNDDPVFFAEGLHAGFSKAKHCIRYLKNNAKITLASPAAVVFVAAVVKGGVAVGSEEADLPFSATAAGPPLPTVGSLEYVQAALSTKFK